MPLLDLNKFTIHTTVLGIVCPVCGGELLPVADKRPSWWQALFRRPGKGTQRYVCKECGRGYKMSSTTAVTPQDPDKPRNTI